MTDKTCTELADELATAPWSGPIGSKFVGVCIGLADDIMVEAANQALRAGFLFPIKAQPEDYSQPVEAIDALGRDALLLRYPGEDHYSSLRTRVRDKWDFWTQGIKPALLDELTAAGFAGAQIFVPNDFTPRPLPVDYWSRFWLMMPAGTHPVTGTGGFIMNTGVVGVTRLGPAGLNTEAGEVYFQQMRSVLSRMKPAQWIVWDIIFEVTPGVLYIHEQFRPRFADPNYQYSNNGANFPL